MWNKKIKRKFLTKSREWITRNFINVKLKGIAIKINKFPISFIKIRIILELAFN